MKTTITTNFTKTSLRVLRGLLLICLLAFTGTNQLNAQCNAMTGIVNIPDSAFKAYLVGKASINTNGDAEIQCSEAAAFTGGINVNNLSISSLTGIEAFINITALSCDNNPLGSLDVSHNTAFARLYCFINRLTSLDLAKNTALSSLFCYGNKLTSLDLTKNTLLNILKIGRAHV